MLPSMFEKIFCSAFCFSHIVAIAHVVFYNSNIADIVEIAG